MGIPDYILPVASNPQILRFIDKYYRGGGHTSCSGVCAMNPSRRAVCFIDRIFFVLSLLMLPGCGGNGGGGSGTPPPIPGATGLQRVNHVIVMMQENHSFDNYLGAVAYAPGSPYHPGPCAAGDNQCVDGLS